jgi:hypothetical protein
MGALALVGVLGGGVVWMAGAQETNAAFRLSASGESDPAHRAAHSSKPIPWPGGRIPYDVSKLTEARQKLALKAMKRWEETGANIQFTPRSNEVAYVFFTGRTDAGNNTSCVGYPTDHRTEINITAFWWTQGEWMPVHELGHAIGFFHEHERWDRDAYVTVHYENMKPERRSDYDWIPKTNWITSATAYDYYSIMHYRTCWTSINEKECRDGDGESPCAVLDPVGTNYDGVIGQWSTYGISAVDAEKARAVYGTRAKQP